MTDTSRLFMPAGTLGSGVKPKSGLVCKGRNYNLVLVNAAPSTEFWSALRTDLSGNLIDTMPVPLSSEIGTPVVASFTPVRVSWSDPYFYIAGVFTSHADGTNSTAYVRVAEDLSIVDDPPVELGWIPPGSWYVDGTDLWILSTTRVTLFDMDNNLRVLDQLQYDSVWNPRASVASDGLYVSVRDRSDSFMRNLYITADGNVLRLDSLTFGGFESSLFYSLGGVQHSDDSVVFCFFDISSAGDLLFRYYFLSRSDLTAGTEMHSIPIPFWPGGRWWTRSSLNFSRGLLLAMSSYGGSSNIALYTFDLRNQELVVAGHIGSTTVPNYKKFLGTVATDSLGMYYHIDGYGVEQISFELMDPFGTMQVSPVFFNTAHYRQPSLLADDSGLLLYSQYADSANVSFKGYRFSDPHIPVPSTSFEIMDDLSKPYRPTIYSAGQKKALFFREDVTDTDPLHNSVYTFRQRMVVFEGDYPGPSDLQNAHDLPRLKGDWDFRPSCMVADSLVYFDALCRHWPGNHGNDSRLYLHSLDLSTDELTPFSVLFPANGQTALARRADTLLSVRGQKNCREWGKFGCEQFGYGYVTHAYHGDTTLRVDLFAFGSSYFIDSVATDVVASPFGDDYVYALRQYKRLVQFNDETSTYEQVADLSSYASPEMGWCKIYPIQTASTNCAVLVGENHMHNRLLVFDRAWNFYDSATLPLTGIPMEFSEFVAIPDEDMIMFAYSSYVIDGYSSARLFLQTIGIDVVTDISDDEPLTLPLHFQLDQNHPNPFNAGTTIGFSLPYRLHAEIVVYNSLGQEVSTILDETKPAGKHSIYWNGTDRSGNTVSTGVYLYRITAGGFVKTKKMILLK